MRLLSEANRQNGCFSCHPFYFSRLRNTYTLPWECHVRLVKPVSSPSHLEQENTQNRNFKKLRILSLLGCVRLFLLASPCQRRQEVTLSVVTEETMRIISWPWYPRRQRSSVGATRTVAPCQPVRGDLESDALRGTDHSVLSSASSPSVTWENSVL